MGKKEEDKLRDDLSLHRAMRIDAYRDPAPLDQKETLAASTETGRFGGKLAYGFACDNDGTPRHREFKRIEPIPFYEDPTLALIAFRNARSRLYATRLRDLDAEIEKFVAGSGILPGCIIVKGDAIEAPVASVTADPTDDREAEGPRTSLEEAVRQIEAGEDNPGAVIVVADESEPALEVPSEPSTSDELRPCDVVDPETDPNYRDPMAAARQASREHTEAEVAAETTAEPAKASKPKRDRKPRVKT